VGSAFEIIPRESWAEGRELPEQGADRRTRLTNPGVCAGAPAALGRSLPGAAASKNRDYSRKKVMAAANRTDVKGSSMDVST